MNSSDIQVHAIRVKPHDGPLTAPLRLEIDYSSSAALARPLWSLQFVADVAATRHVVSLLEQEAAEPIDAHQRVTFVFETAQLLPEAEVAGREDTLLNMAMLSAMLHDTEPKELPLLTINFIVAVTKGENGELQREIYNPLEENTVSAA
ncbi:MAG: hypothetical protein MHM6MM_000551 [Cercozoa sp. M6MM]